jgi:hypothetical protein
MAIAYLRVLLATASAVLLGALPAAAATAPATVTDKWTTQAPSSSAGRAYSVDFVNPADPNGKPPSFSHVHLQLPPGARFDTDAIPQCHANDAELMAQGGSACPADTQLGTNKATFDTGIDAARFLYEDVTFFNRHDQLVILTQDEASGARAVVRGTVGQSTLDIDLPPLPGTPPDGAAEKSERAVFLARSTSRGNYLTTPPQCPAAGVWTEHVTFTFRDGSTYTTAYDNPCRHAAPTAAAPRHVKQRRRHHRRRHVSARTRPSASSG